MNFKHTWSNDDTIEYRLIDISKSFNGEVVLDKISLDMPKKGILVISGPSGRGKTSLIRIINNFIEADSGSMIGFENVRIAYLFQEDRLLPWYDALSNMLTVTDKENALYWLEKLGLGDSIHKYPDELSGGMRRRLALARTFAYSGDIYILDEPFKGSDPALRDSLVDITKEACIGKLLIVVTHDKEEEIRLLS